MRLRLDAVLRAKGMSRRDLATKLQKTTQFVNYIAKEERCNFTTVGQLAEALDVPERELLEFER